MAGVLDRLISDAERLARTADTARRQGEQGEAAELAGAARRTRALALGELPLDYDSLAARLAEVEDPKLRAALARYGAAVIDKKLAGK